jgi:hypothetical protein
LLVPLEVAVSVAFWAVETADALAEKAALLAPAGTVTEEGTLTAALLLASLIVTPKRAEPFSVTLHASVPAPVMDALLQEIDCSAGRPSPAKLNVPDVPDSGLFAR